MACKETGEEKMSPHFMEKLTALRKAYGKPIIITSGYRSINHSIERKKDTVGAHVHGRACDIACRGADAHKLIRLALEIFPRVGISQKGTARFIHVDDMKNSEGFISPHVWSY